MRECSKCGVAKPDTDFRLRKSTNTGRHYRGKVCTRCHSARSLEWRRENPEKIRGYNENSRSKNPERAKKAAIASHFRRKFGLTIEQRDQLLAGQGGRCLVCGTTSPRGKGWCVDHCHRSGRIRGILCAACNCFIGLAKEDVFILRQAIKYLEEK